MQGTRETSAAPPTPARSLLEARLEQPGALHCGPLPPQLPLLTLLPLLPPVVGFHLPAACGAMRLLYSNLPPLPMISAGLTAAVVRAGGMILGDGGGG